MSKCESGPTGPVTESRERLNSLVWIVISLTFGWSLFFYWWWVVLLKEGPAPVMHILTGIAAFAAVFLGFTYCWIWHNGRLADRGHRESEMLIGSPGYEHDALGRAVTHATDLHIQDASVVVIESTDATKTFSAHHFSIA